MTHQSSTKVRMFAQISIVAVAAWACASCSGANISAAFGKDRAAFEAVLGKPTGTRKDEYRPSETTYDYRFNDKDVALSVDDKSSRVKMLTIFGCATWQTAVKALGLDPTKIKVGDRPDGTLLKFDSYPGADFANWYPDTGGLTIFMAEPKTAVVPFRASDLPATVSTTLRSVIGQKDNGAILASMKKISPGPAEVDGKIWLEMDGGYSVLDFDIGNGGSKAMLDSPLGKLPVGILYVGRGDKGKGPAFLKLTFIRDGTFGSVKSLVSVLTGSPEASLSIGPVTKNDDSQVRMVSGSKYVVYCVAWKGDPKDATAQVVIAARPEDMAFVTIS